MKNSLIILVLTMLLASGNFKLCAQVVDDSTTQVYGPHSTKYLLEQEVKFNQFKVHNIDTGLYDMENFGLFDKSHRQYQDLGANGTAIRPVWYETPNTIGKRSGYDAYDPFFRDASKFRYFDTKSPFLDLSVAFGGIGRSLVDFGYSQNINPKWNFGFDISRLESDKQIGPSSSTGDKNTVSTSLDFYTYFRSKNNKYLILALAQRFSHKVEETGGVYTDEEEPTDPQLFRYEDSPIKLSDAFNEDKRSNLHMFQEYRVGKLLQVYHQFDFLSQKVFYSDENDGSSITGYDAWGDYYSNFYLNASSTSEANLFRTISNEFGVKGDIEKGFYSAYVKQRNVFNEFRYIEEEVKESEIYIGGTLRYDLNENNALGGDVQFLQTGDFEFNGNITNKFFDARYQIMQYQPSILSEQYFGNHYFWDNSFQSILTNELAGVVHLDVWKLSLHPNVSFRTLSNYVYYNESSLPTQINNDIILSTYGVDFSFKLPTSSEFEDAIIFDNEFKYTRTDGDTDKAIRIPELYYYGKLFWNGMIFKRSMQVNIGFDLSYRDNYFGLDYNPVVQQFFLQNDREFKQYFVVDAFLNFKVNTMRIFFKLNHINQRNNDGYFVTPFYPGQQQVIDLGVKWQFFD